MKNILFGFLFIIALLGIIACTEPEVPKAPIEPQPAVIPEEPVDTLEDTEVITEESTIKEFNLVASRWEFTPGTLRVKEGDTVKLNIRSDDVTHGFRIAEFGVNQRLTPGETVTIEFIADKKGTFNFFCSIPCGSGHSSMRGKLIVE